MGLVSGFYNRIAADYATGANADLYRRCHALALSQLRTHGLLAGLDRVLDLGVGDGLFLSALHELVPAASYVGLDASDAMLLRAADRLPLRSVCASIDDALDCLSGETFNLVVAHFVLSYVGTDLLLSQAAGLLPVGGHLSLMTTTMNNFPQLRFLFNRMCASSHASKRYIGNQYQRLKRHVRCPANVEEVLDLAAARGFSLVSHEAVLIPLVFADPSKLIDWFVYGGWAGRSKSRIMPLFLYKKILCKICASLIDEFPFREEFAADAFLFKKTV